MKMTLRGLNACQVIAGLSMLAEDDQTVTGDVVRWAAIDGEAELEVQDDNEQVLDNTVVAYEQHMKYSMLYQGGVWRALKLW